MTSADHPFSDIPAVGSAGMRYEVLGVLGIGSYGTVYEVRDRDLGRDIAIKVLDPALSGKADDRVAFLEEARSSARLDHPGIVPVYDVGSSADGSWFAMKRIAGMTVEQGLLSDPRPAALIGIAAIVMTFIRISEAMGSAHAMGTVHRDLKPANLLLGEHGEVWVSDWGLASRSGSTHGDTLVGTPLYMAPEQACCAPVSPAWDIYAIGAVLHEVVYGVPPLLPGEDDWWERKKAGVTDALVGQHPAVPAALSSIIRRCLEVESARRYQDGAALATDLRAFMDDGVVAAHRERLPARLVRLARRHRWALAIAGPFLLVCVMLGVALAQERLARWASWGEPIADLNSPGWVTAEGDYTLVSGVATSRSGQNNVRIFTRPLEGSVAIEYDATMDPDQPPGDVSLAIGRGLQRRPADGVITGLKDPLYCMTAAWDDTGTRIRLSDGTTIASSQRRLIPGIVARVRLELLAGEVVLAIDGHEECRAPLLVLDGPRYCSLYAYYPGKIYKNLHIWQRGLSAQVPATAIGDAFLSQDPQDSQHAAEQFARVVASSVDPAIADHARVRHGLALLQAGDGTAADAAWAEITAEDLRQEAYASGVMLCVRTEHLEEAALRWQRLTGRKSAMAQAAWSSFVRASRLSPAAWAATDALLASGNGLPDSLLVREGRADLLMARELWAPALVAARDIQPQQAFLQLILGTAGEALADSSTPPSLRAEALMRCGRFAEVEAQRPTYAATRARALLYSGRAADVLTATWAEPQQRDEALLALDRPLQILEADQHADSAAALRALVRSGHVSEALKRAPKNIDLMLASGQTAAALAIAKAGAEWRRMIVWQAVMNGTLPQPNLTPSEVDDRDQLLCAVIAPWLRAMAGQADGRQALAIAARDVRDARAWRIAPLAQAVLTGSTLSGSVPFYQVGDQALARALAADLAGQRQVAISAWATWQTLSPAQRNPNDEPVLELLARVRQLAR